MSQGAGQSKRSPSPAHVYGPMVYQFPPEGEGESTPPKNNKGANPVTVLIVLLAIGAVALYFRRSEIDVGQLNLKRSFVEDQMVSAANYDHRNSHVITQARVAADSLYLREGPGIIYVATYLLPENWRVSLIGDYETDDYGEVWARVLVQTDEGLQEGWVSRRYLD